MEYLIVYVIVAALGFAVLYAVVRSAVRAALFDHYKITRWYEQTGEWRTVAAFWKNPPRDVALAGTDAKPVKK